jgi:hypothetical protein
MDQSIIVYFIGRELKDTIIVAYLLEYYSQHERDNPGWMSTVSKALPLLYKYNYGLFFDSNDSKTFKVNL